MLNNPPQEGEQGYYANVAARFGYKNGEVVRQMAKTIKVPNIRQNVQANRTKADPLTTEEKVKRDRLVQKESSEKVEVSKKYKALFNECEQLRKERDAVIKLATGPDIFKIEPVTGFEANEATAVIVASDWHIEEEVRPETVNGLNKFTLDIADQRAEKFWQNALRLLKMSQRDITIKNVVLALLGDFISGNIHEELLETCSLSPADAIWKAQNMIASGIKFLLKNTDVSLVIPCHSGNHGRITKKLHVSTEQGNSLEAYMYRNLQLHFADEPRVKFLISESYHSYVEVYRFTLRFHHGTYIKYNGGIGGVEIPAKKAISQWNKMRRADLDVFGHWHQQKLDAGEMVINGSLVGFNPYALSIKAEYQKPTQSFFLINKKEGKGLCAPIFLD